LKRLPRFLLATTIVAAIPLHLGAAAAVSEDVPIRGGRAALAATFGIKPIPDRARFVSEFARLLHGLSDRKPMLPEVLAQQLRQSASGSGAGELVPIPLTAAVWSKAVFLRPVAPADLVIAILGDRQASLLCYGLAGLDDDCGVFSGTAGFHSVCACGGGGGIPTVLFRQSKQITRLLQRTLDTRRRYDTGGVAAPNVPVS